jgi:hypothetical protein
MSNKQKPNGQHPPTAAGNNSRIYEDAVAEGKNIIKKMAGEQRAYQLRLGELAHKVETTYGGRTSKFAKAIGVEPCTLKRYLSVYRAWDGAGKVAPGPVCYAVLRELEKLPNREEIVKANPQITKRKAQELRHAYEGRSSNNNNNSSDWQANERRRWLNRLCSFANEHGRTAEEVMGNRAAMRALREIAEPELAAALVSALEVLVAFAKLLQRQDEQTEKAKRRKPHLKEAERAGVVA